jgi:FAD/FMN-containing dehydrogenase
VGLLQTKLNKVLAVDPAQHTMRVGAGMTITELTQAATQNKMSLQVRWIQIPLCGSVHISESP